MSDDVEFKRKRNVFGMNLEYLEASVTFDWDGQIDFSSGDISSDGPCLITGRGDTPGDAKKDLAINLAKFSGELKDLVSQVDAMLAKLGEEG